MREIVFDTETTGLDPKQGDRIVEIGCIELINRVETGNTYHAYYNPGMAMPSIAEQVHGLSDTFLSDKPYFEDTVEDLLDFLGDSPLVAHNAMFDFGFLNAELGNCGRLHISMSRMIDTLAISKTRHPGAKHSLDALCTRYGVDRSHRVNHGALLDAALLSQVYIELTGGRQIGLDIGNLPITPPDSQSLPGSRAAYARQPRLHHPTPEEVRIHRLFVATLTDPLWATNEKWATHADA